MTIIVTLLVGFVVGLIAKILMPGRDPGGFIITILLGIGGAFVGAWMGQNLGWYAPGEPASFLVSVGGAILLLLIYRLLFRRRA
jgi:uncharacterized membrane protein YeaQ/YmgE (transglycosylase-associated protein family)